MDKIILSPLPKTWLLDVDGTIVTHNGHLHDNEMLLPGVKEFFKNIRDDDKVILLTSRSIEYKIELEDFLIENNIRFDEIIYNLPFGERILINDKKSSGLKMAYCVNKKRDSKLEFEYEIDENL